MDKKRILELALETLQKHKAAVEAEIEAIRGEMKSEIRQETAKKPETAAPAASISKQRTAAERKAQSDRMKAYWAKRKAKAATKTK